MNLKGKVSSVKIVGCSIASNLKPNPPNDHLMEELAVGLSTQGRPVTVSGWATDLIAVGKEFLGIPLHRDDYWIKEDANANLISVTR